MTTAAATTGRPKTSSRKPSTAAPPADSGREAERSGSQHISFATRRLLRLHAAWAEVVSAPGDVIELVAAVTSSQPVSTRIGNGLLWVILVGPPSSAKTVAVSSTRGVPIVYFLDSLTENSFITGFVPDKGKPQDLLAQLDGKVLVLKEMSALFSLKDDVINKVLGDLCAIYDGSFSKFTGTRGKVEYHVLFPFLGCITPRALEQHSRHISVIGPRFLYYRLPGLTAEAVEEGEDLVWADGGKRRKFAALGKAMQSVGKPLLKPTKVRITSTDEQRKYLTRLANLVAHGRAAVSFVKEGTNYTPDAVQREEPWRGVYQLRVLAEALARVHGRWHLTDHELELCRRVALSTMPESRYRMLSLFFGNPEGGLTISKFMASLGKSRARIEQMIRELVMIGLLVKDAKEGHEDTYLPNPRFDDMTRASMAPLDHVGDLTNQAVSRLPTSPTATGVHPGVSVP